MKLAQIPKELVQENYNGNPKDLATSLNVSMSSAYFLLKKYGLELRGKKRMNLQKKKLESNSKNMRME